MYLEPDAATASGPTENCEITMAMDNDITKLRNEITNLEFAVRLLREAANEMRDQRDDARREARQFRQRIQIVALVIVMTVLLIVGAVAYTEEAESWGRQQARIDHPTIFALVLQTGVPGTVLSTQLAEDIGHISDEIGVASKNGQTQEENADEESARFLQFKITRSEYIQKNLDSQSTPATSWIEAHHKYQNWW